MNRKKCHFKGFSKWLNENTIEKYSRKYFTAQEKRMGDSISITLEPTPFFASGVDRNWNFFVKQVNEMQRTLKDYLLKLNDTYWEELQVTIPWKEYLKDSEGNPGNAQGYLAKTASTILSKFLFSNKKTREGMDALVLNLSRPGQADWRPNETVPEDQYAL